MKQGKWTRITAVLFAAAMLVSLSACGDMPPATGDPTTTSTTTTTTNTAEETTTTTTETTTETTTATTTATTTTTTAKKPTTTTTTTTTKYVPEIENLEPLSAKQEAEIKDYWVSRFINPEPQHTADAVKITYYGTYNGYIALTIKDNYWSYPGLVWDEEIAGIQFDNFSGFGIKLWKNGEMLELETAYEQGILTQVDLRDIEYYYSGD